MNGSQFIGITLGLFLVWIGLTVAVSVPVGLIVVGFLVLVIVALSYIKEV
jgi:hypothetical protein